jgi:hypothetical protein
MTRIITGIASLLVGFSFVIFFKFFAQFTIEQQNKSWGFHFGNRAIKLAQITYIIVGIGFIVISILSFFKIT